MSDPPPPPSYVRVPSVRFLGSLEVDQALARCDLAGSVAHVEMLARAGLISPPERTQLLEGLRRLGREVATGTFPWRAELEDVHTNLESRLTELIGPAGGKLHTARSRNDQVALDERLFLRSAVAEVVHGLLALETAILARARTEAGTPMPGYTHLQRAQPVTVGHWLLAHFWRFERDLDRLRATMARANVSPLGAGAIAGSTLPIDPAFVAERLGFDRPFENSMDAVSDRDYFAELLFDLSLLAVHLSAVGEEVVLYATKEFGFLERNSALGSGSSLMPQKRNPDVAELVRGKTGRVVGDLVALLTTLKGLPLSYDRDLQEDKAPVLDAVRTVSSVLDATRSLVEGLTFISRPLEAAVADPELFATDLAETLVGRGVPFRTAHETIGALYAGGSPPGPEALAGALGPSTSLSASPFDPVRSLDRRASPGGPGPVAVGHQIATAESRLAGHRAFLSSLDRQVGLIEELLSEDQR